MMRISSIVRTTAGIAAVAASTMAIASGTPAAAEDSVAGRIRDTQSLNVRHGPSLHTPITGRLSKGDKIRIRCEISGTNVAGQPTWYALSDRSGYVSGAYVDTGDYTPHECPNIETTYGVAHTTTAVNVRNGPSRQDRRVATLAPGTKIRVVCSATDTGSAGARRWYALDTYTGEDGEPYPRQGQWVAADFVQGQATVPTCSA